MRHFIIAGLMAAALFPATAMAQSAAELRRDRLEMREQQRDLAQARRHGDRRDVRDARRDVRDARREYRQDWRDYRRAHRDVYRQPAYVGPRGWAYRPLAPGYRLERGYYAPRYVIADPYRYRLPVVRGSLRWVRYGNDVLLVDTRTGRVRDVYRDFFW